MGKVQLDLKPETFDCGLTKPQKEGRGKISILERNKGDTRGTIICPHCRKWICLTGETFDDHKKKLKTKKVVIK